MKIITYDDKFKNQVVALVLYIQNFENCVDLSLEEQPDLKDVSSYYLGNGGGFWIALDNSETVIGTLGLLKRENNCGVLKKFFVSTEYRGKQLGISAKLFERLLEHAIQCEMDTIILDTPSACERAHAFYRNMGFVEVDSEQLPIQYSFPDRDSLLFLKKLK